jgi:hypothetical protein
MQNRIRARTHRKSTGAGALATGTIRPLNWPVSVVVYYDPQSSDGQGLPRLELQRQDDQSRFLATYNEIGIIGGSR